MNAFFDATNRMSFFLHHMVALFIENLTKQCREASRSPYITSNIDGYV